MQNYTDTPMKYRSTFEQCTMYAMIQSDLPRFRIAAALLPHRDDTQVREIINEDCMYGVYNIYSLHGVCLREDQEVP